MTTDEEKSHIAKLLKDLEVPEVKLTERCSEIIKDFHQKFDKEIEEAEQQATVTEIYENPYKPDKKLLDENERKLKELLAECKRAKTKSSDCKVLPGPDPKRPWRTNSSKEKLVRIDNELKQHIESATQLITPLPDEEMKELVKECRQETLSASSVSADRLRHTVDAARKNLSNFQYRKIENTTATAILPDAHGCSGQFIPRPPTKHCFIRNLATLRNLRLLALEYSQVADGTGGALLALLTIMKRPHFRLQLICRKDQIPGRADAALGVGGYGIPDTAWKRVAIACPDIYVQMVFFRVRDYDNVRRFLTPSIPLRETHLQFGIDLKMRQRQDSDISCFVRHIAHFYTSTLVTVSIHQWRFAIFQLRCVFELMPRLVRFHYVGLVEDEVDIKRMLMIVATGVCDKLKLIKIQIQDVVDKREYWQNVVTSINKEFQDIMKLYDINLCISLYKN